MNVYLLTFKQGSRVIYAWHHANNAGEAIDLLEEKGIDVIKTVRLKTGTPEFYETQSRLPDLVFWVRLMESDIRYKELQHKPELEGLTKIEL